MDNPRTETSTDPRAVTRGSDSQTETVEVIPFGVHWIRGTVPAEMLGAVREHLQMLFGDFESRKYGLWFYDRSDQWTNGVSLQYHSTEERLEITKGRVCVEIPGSALDDFDGLLVRMLMRGLDAYDFQASRIDVYHDDYERIITPGKLFEMVYESSLYDGSPIRADFSGFLRIQHKQEHHKTKGVQHDEVDFGRRGSEGSGKYLRIYDKRLESQGRLSCVRWELELSDKRARKAWEAITRTEGETAEDLTAAVASVIGSMIGAAVDFRKRTGDKNLDRLERFEWWTRLLERMGRDPDLLRIQREKKKVHRTLEYVIRQVSGSLQMLHKAMGAAEFLPVLIDITTSEDRLRVEHWQAIKDYQNLVGSDAVLNIKGFREYCDEKDIPIEGEDDNAMPEL